MRVVYQLATEMSNHHTRYGGDLAPVKLKIMCQTKFLFQANEKLLILYGFWTDRWYHYALLVSGVSDRAFITIVTVATHWAHAVWEIKKAGQLKMIRLAGVHVKRNVICNIWPKEVEQNLIVAPPQSPPQSPQYQHQTNDVLTITTTMHNHSPSNF